MWHLELQIKYQNNRGCKSHKWSDASIGTGSGWKPDMSCKSTLWGCTNINFVNIYNVFVLANTESQAGMVEMADTSDLSSDSKE